MRMPDKKYIDKRTVAVLDILGFKNILNSPQFPLERVGYVYGAAVHFFEYGEDSSYEIFIHHDGGKKNIGRNKIGIFMIDDKWMAYGFNPRNQFKQVEIPKCDLDKNAKEIPSEKKSGLIQMVLKSLLGTLKCKKYIFSDSIIIISEDDSEESCKDTIIYSKLLMQRLIAVMLPVRGGIAFDELYHIEEDNIFVGNGLLKASNLEKKQEWLGLIIDWKLQESFPELIKDLSTVQAVSLGLASPEIIKYQVPIKKNKKNGDVSHEEYYTVNWLNGVDIPCLGEAFHFMENEMTPPEIETSNEIHQRYEETKKFVDYIKLNYAYNEKVPAESGL